MSVLVLLMVGIDSVTSAQDGAPMLTVDPGTLGNRMWEFNSLSCFRRQEYPLSFRRNPRGRITGKVLDTHETFVAGSEVLTNSNATGEEFTTTSGPNGLFVFADLRTGDYFLTATRRGFESKPIKNVPVVVEGSMTEVLIDGGPAQAAANTSTATEKNYRFLQSNGLLIEEAYHQEMGEVQHTFSAIRGRDGLWASAFSQEWPLWSEKHQLSVTMPMQLTANVLDGGRRGIGDIEVGYSYFLIGTNDTRVTVSPGVSLFLPTGSVRSELGKGAPGLEVKVPVSVMLSERLVTHTNVGATFTRAAKNREGERANLFDLEAGQGLVWLAHPKFNVLMDVVWERGEAVAGNRLRTREYEFTVSPGIRWGHTFKSGLAIIPGIAVPIGFGPSQGKRGMFLSVTFEHSFKRHRQ